MSSLYEKLRQADPEEARQAAMALLYEIEQRQPSEWMHIVDPNTGQIQRYFTANGTKYTVLTAQDRTSIFRTTEFRKMALLVGSEPTLSTLIERLTNLQRLINTTTAASTPLYELSIGIENIRQSLREAANDWTPSLRACTYFIVTEGEDLATYDPAHAEKKILDWNEAGIHPPDFFFLALNMEQELSASAARLLTQFLR